MWGMETPSNLSDFPVWAMILIIFLVIWSTVWKGIALWKAGRLSHRNWFILLLVVNTFGILEIIYIYFIAKKYTVETVDSK